MTRFKQFSAVASMAATLSMAASPVVAAELPVSAPKTFVEGVTQWDADAMNAERHRRRYRRNRVGAGDILAGVLILGGIAAIADAASRNNRDRRNRQDSPRYRAPTSNSRSGGGQGIERAVDMCMRSIERDVRVEAVDKVDRTGAGWNVSGTLYNGSRFNCEIDSEGRVGNVSYGQGAGAGSDAPYQSGQVEDRQWNDDRYAAAWNRVDNGQSETQQARSPAPYPGGPVEGDLTYEDDGMGG